MVAIWRAVAVAGLGFAGLAGAESLTGQVVAVLDGDTIVVRDDARGGRVTVRLAQIDAPEKGQPYGMAARRALADAVFLRPVRVDTQGRDDYGRTVGRVFQGGEDMGLRQVEAGLAWAFRRYLRDPASPVIAAEAAARQAGRGLWHDPAPVPPWDFRHGARPGPAMAPEGASRHHLSAARPRIYEDLGSGNPAGSGSGADPGYRPPGDGTVHTGPRGGRFTYSESGAKHYLPRPR